MTGASFDELFRSTRREVDDVLADVPQSLLEARRMVTRELQFDPRPEELQAIVKIAGFMSTSIICYELPRQMLALRVLAERKLSECWGSRRLSADTLGHTGSLIEELLLAAERSRGALSADGDELSTLSDDERAYLMHVRDVLEVPQERLEASTILAPRLELVAKQVATGNISETFPGLSDDEVEMFNQAVHLDNDEQQGPGRVCLDAIALRTVYEEYLEVWDRSGYLDDAELIARLQEEIRGQLGETETAYRVVSANLQQQQDEAITACLEDFAEDIRGAKSRLFEAYVKAQSLTRETAPVEVEETAGRSLAETLDEAESADERTAEREKSSEALYRKALTSVRRDRTGKDGRTHPLELARQRRRRRVWAMTVTIAVLALAAGAVHFLMPEPVADPVTVSLKEFEPALSVIDAKPIGSMLYVRVSDWEQLSVQKTRFRTAEIGEVASAKGLSLAYVVSDAGKELAEWHANGGVLVRSKATDTAEVPEGATQRVKERTIFTGN